MVSARYMEISMVNTYLWIRATAISSIISINSIIENWFITEIGILVKVSKICPAVMFAHNRTDRVIGRISCLTDSINTINWESIIGVERGTKCLKKLLMLCTLIYKMVLAQNGRARVKVKVIWLEIVKTYGISPQVFKMRIIKKVVRRIKVFIFELGLLNDVLSSEYIYILIFFIIIVYREYLLYLIIFNVGTRRIVEILIVFMLSILIIGSKFSNKLIIIFIGLGLI
jgi:hypothetical protein